MLLDGQKCDRSLAGDAQGRMGTGAVLGRVNDLALFSGEIRTQTWGFLSSNSYPVLSVSSFDNPIL